MLGGGVSSGNWDIYPPTVTQSYPSSDNSWLIILENNEPFVSIIMDIWATCAYRS